MTSGDGPGDAPSQVAGALGRVSTVREAALALARLLARAGVPEARLEADLLLAHVLDTDRTHLLASLEDPLPPPAVAALVPLAARRLAREPLPYILGAREFFGLPLAVRPGVLVPRQETETLVEEALRLAPRYGPTPVVADVGCGVGAVAVALAVHLPGARVYAVDTSPTALEVTAENCRRHGVAARVQVLRSDLLEAVPGPVDLVAANLPYVRSDELPHLEPEVRHEPPEALDGGPDGLRVIQRLLRALPGPVRPGGVVLLECDPRQVARLRELARALLPRATVRTVRDLAHLERVVVLEGL